MAPDEAHKGALLAERGGHGARVVLVHGFTQTGRSMTPLARLLEESHEVVTLDLPFHGRRPAPAASLEEAAQLVGATCGRASYLGYSLGGRVCLTLALEQPELVHSLVLVGATPGLRSEADRAARRAADELLATRLEGPGEEGARREAFLADWLAGPLFSRLDAAQADLESRRQNSCAGLAAALRNLGTGSQQPSHERLGALAMPVLLLAGERDEKFSAIAEEMRLRDRRQRRPAN